MTGKVAPCLGIWARRPWPFAPKGFLTLGDAFLTVGPRVVPGWTGTELTVSFLPEPPRKMISELPPPPGNQVWIEGQPWTLERAREANARIYEQADRERLEVNRANGGLLERTDVLLDWFAARLAGGVLEAYTLGGTGLRMIDASNWIDRKQKAVLASGAFGGLATPIFIRSDGLDGALGSATEPKPDAPARVPPVAVTLEKERAVDAWFASERRTTKDMEAYGREHGISREFLRRKRQALPEHLKRAPGEKKRDA